MPKLIEEKEIKLDRADLLKRILPVRTLPLTRSPGLHASGLLRYVAQTSGITAYKEQLESEELPLRMALGLAWEEFAVSLHPEIVWQPGEQLEPVINNCDGISFDDTVPTAIVEEFKLTWRWRKPGAELLAAAWTWVQQAAIYCLTWQAERVRWHVCWVNGEGFKQTGGPGPMYVTYLASFSAKELDETRQMIDKNRQKAIDAGYSE